MKAITNERRLKIIDGITLLGGDVGTVEGLTLADGGKIDDAKRDEILLAVREGRHVEIRMSVLAFVQEEGKPNRKFVRFSPGAMHGLGASFVGMPFLRDHEQGDTLARGGTIVASKSAKLGDGKYQISQEVVLSAPWAVDLAVRGLLSSVSIGFRATGPVMCSACNAQVFTRCYHLPGDRLEVVEDQGRKSKVRKADGAEIVEWVYTAARGVETSSTPVPAVVEAKIEEIRASLSDVLGAADAAQSAFAAQEEGSMLDLEKLAKVLGAAAPTEEAIAKRAEALGSELQIVTKERDAAIAAGAADKAELAVLKKEAMNVKREEFLRAGIAEGKLSPGDKDLWGTLWDTDPKRAAELLAQRSPQSATPVGAKLQSSAPEPARVDPAIDEKKLEAARVAGIYGQDPATVEAIMKELG